MRRWTASSAQRRCFISSLFDSLIKHNILWIKKVLFVHWAWTRNIELLFQVSFNEVSLNFQMSKELMLNRFQFGMGILKIHTTAQKFKKVEMCLGR